MNSIDDYIEAKKADGDLSEDTLRTRKTYLNKMDEWAIENVGTHLWEFDVKDCIKVFEQHLQPKWRKDGDTEVVRDKNGRFKEIKSEGISTDTARIYFNALESFMDESLGRIEKQEQEFDKWFSDMKSDIPDSDYNKKLSMSDPGTLTEDEINSIIEAAGIKYKVIYSLMLDSGRRPKEVASIKLSEIDFDNNRIHYDILKKDLPTKAWVKIQDEVVELIEEYIKFRVDDNDEYLFETNSKQGFLTVSSMNKAFKRHADACGVELKGRSLKNIRHTYVTFRRRQGDTFAKISKTGTHNTVDVMQKSYSGEATDEEYRSGMEMLEDDNKEE